MLIAGSDKEDHGFCLLGNILQGELFLLDMTCDPVVGGQVRTRGVVFHLVASQWTGSHTMRLAPDYGEIVLAGADKLGLAGRGGEGEHVGDGGEVAAPVRLEDSD